MVGRSESATVMPSISGLLVFSHVDSGARLALREYDHAFFFTDSTASPALWRFEGLACEGPKDASQAALLGP